MQILKYPGLVGLLAMARIATAEIVYVDADAPGGGNGMGWATAFDDLQAALAAASAGDEIWVAEGTYRPAGAGGDRAISFTIVDELSRPEARLSGELHRLDPRLAQRVASVGAPGDPPHRHSEASHEVAEDPTSRIRGALLPTAGGEDRDPREVLCLGEHRVAAAGVGARNPAFDITPADHLAGLITDRGLIQPVTTARIKEMLEVGR